MGIVFLGGLDDNSVQNKTEPKPKTKKDEIEQNNGTNAAEGGVNKGECNM